ncbi:MAG: type II toxin-antitoxin system RelE/ParE family toxin [Defluviitaleaceae bacterium]|nr:type II toxin-antitoxin system RelE/ParE family toxin [Defluviitaleaceae bacterium]
MRELLWTETAKKDLQCIYDYIAKDSVYYADKFADELFERVEILKIFPNTGRVIPELKLNDMREVFLHSYRIMYQVKEDAIYVTQLTHMARDFKQ